MGVRSKVSHEGLGVPPNWSAPSCPFPSPSPILLGVVTLHSPGEGVALSWVDRVHLAVEHRHVGVLATHRTSVFIYLSKLWITISDRVPLGKKRKKKKVLSALIWAYTGSRYFFFILLVRVKFPLSPVPACLGQERFPPM